MAEAAEGAVEVTNVEPTVLSELLRFLYTGDCALTPDKDGNAPVNGDSKQETVAPADGTEAAVEWQCKLFAAAHFFQVKALQDVLLGKLKKVTASGFVKQLLLAETYDLSRLKVWAVLCSILLTDVLLSVGAALRVMRFARRGLAECRCCWLPICGRPL